MAFALQPFTFIRTAVCKNIHSMTIPHIILSFEKNILKYELIALSSKVKMRMQMLICTHSSCQRVFSCCLCVSSCYCVCVSKCVRVCMCVLVHVGERVRACACVLICRAKKKMYLPSIGRYTLRPWVCAIRPGHTSFHRETLRCISV